MPHDDDLFVNDDLNNSAENRLNHILFGLFVNDRYRREVLRQLGVSENSVIYKPVNRDWGRPDFAIESYEGETIGYIEVELDKDEEQLERYRSKAEVSVYSFGRLEADHDVTLCQLVKIGKDVPGRESTPQLDVMVRHFAKQVTEASGIRKNSPTGPVKAQLNTPLGKALVKAGMVNWGDEPVRLGGIFGRANGPDGLSARVFSHETGDKTVSVFSIRAGGPLVDFSSYSHLADNLPANKKAELESWADMVEHFLDGDVRSIGGRVCRIPISVVEEHVDEVVGALMGLA